MECEAISNVHTSYKHRTKPVKTASKKDMRGIAGAREAGPSATLLHPPGLTLPPIMEVDNSRVVEEHGITSA